MDASVESMTANKKLNRGGKPSDKRRGPKGAGGPFTENSERNRERSLANLKPFQPGQSGNPGGRPKTKHLTHALLKVLESTDKKTGRTIAEVLVAALAKRGRRGDVPALNLIWNRSEGVMAQPIEVSGIESLGEMIKKADEREALEAIEREKPVAAATNIEEAEASPSIHRLEKQEKPKAMEPKNFTVQELIEAGVLKKKDMANGLEVARARSTLRKRLAAEGRG